MIESVLYKS